MNKEKINAVIDIQRKYFMAGNTLDIKNRKNKLRKLKTIIKKYENEVLEALNEDLGKSKTEGYMCEVGLVYEEINYMVKNIKRLTKKQKVKTPLAQFSSKSYKLPSPYGVVLVMSPWNYPFLLAMDPIIDAFAAGNTIVLKTSEYSRKTNQVVRKIIHEAFIKEEVAVVYGGFEENTALMHSDFDYIFFTGSKAVGRIVYQNAAARMIPVTLELGGKSPCIVDESANLKLAAKRIVFGKLLNLGQTCVAPDYLYVQKNIKDKLLEYIKQEIVKQYGKNPLENPNYGNIITPRHYQRLLSLIDESKIVFGGKKDDERLKVEPTIMDNVTENDRIMQDEIFGPVLPVMTFDNLDEVINYVTSHDSPLALYHFSTNKKAIEKISSRISFGGGCINDTIIHLATSNMGFGGVGASGIGQYHGKQGFDTFTHYKSIVNKKNWIDLPMRYQPYKKCNEKLIRMFLK